MLDTLDPLLGELILNVIFVGAITVMLLAFVAQVGVNYVRLVHYLCNRNK